MTHQGFGAEFLQDATQPVLGGRYGKEWFYTLDYLLVFGYEGREM